MKHILNLAFLLSIIAALAACTSDTSEKRPADAARATGDTATADTVQGALSVANGDVVLDHGTLVRGGLATSGSATLAAGTTVDGTPSTDERSRQACCSAVIASSER